MAYEIAGEGRFRVNISRERKAYNIVLRVVPLSIKTFEELNLTVGAEDDRVGAARSGARHRRDRNGQVHHARDDAPGDQPDAASARS